MVLTPQVRNRPQRLRSSFESFPRKRESRFLRFHKRLDPRFRGGDEKTGTAHNCLEGLLQNLPTAVLLAALALSGCSTTNRLVSQWSNPAYSSPPFHKILIGGSGPESAIRRNLEDEFVAQFAARGVAAEPSYRYIPDDQNVDEATLRNAAQQAGADAVILARSVGRERKTEYRGYYPYTSLGFFGPHFGATWYGGYGWPYAYSYDVYASEATLYDVPKNEVVWTGTVRTYDPRNVGGAIKDYVETVLKALQERNLLGANAK